MRYVECPEVYSGAQRALFLAGGISNCPDWQKHLVKLLQDRNLVLLNPRRKEFSINASIEEEQILWEHTHLLKADAVSFWFPCETMCPITLYELGKQSAYEKPIFVGVHPQYLRRRDVEIQTRLARPEVKITYSLEDLAEQIKSWDKLIGSL